MSKGRSNCHASRVPGSEGISADRHDPAAGIAMAVDVPRPACAITAMATRASVPDALAEDAAVLVVAVIEVDVAGTVVEAAAASVVAAKTVVVAGTVVVVRGVAVVKGVVVTALVASLVVAVAVVVVTVSALTEPAAVDNELATGEAFTEVVVLDAVVLDAVVLDAVVLDAAGLDAAGLDDVGIDDVGKDDVGLAGRDAARTPKPRPATGIGPLACSDEPVDESVPVSVSSDREARSGSRVGRSPRVRTRTRVRSTITGAPSESTANVAPVTDTKSPRRMSRREPPEIAMFSAPTTGVQSEEEEEEEEEEDRDGDGEPIRNSDTSAGSSVGFTIENRSSIFASADASAIVHRLLWIRAPRVDATPRRNLDFATSRRLAKKVRLLVEATTTLYSTPVGTRSSASVSNSTIDFAGMSTSNGSSLSAAMKASSTVMSESPGFVKK